MRRNGNDEVTRPRVLITDVDNTLLDWQELWFQTFSAMIGQVLEISGVDSEVLYAQCSAVHQKYGTSEYSQLLQELPCLQELYGERILVELSPAIDSYRKARQRFLQLYPSVEATLRKLKAEGIVIAAYTESQAFYTSYRFRKLGLDGVIDVLYSPADHEMPEEVIKNRRYASASYKLKHTVHHFTPAGELKPNPDILLQIVADLGASSEEAVYVGDNIFKDVAMAQEAGVTDVHAQYGVGQHKPEYDLLRKVTHWTPEMVERERQALKRSDIVPSHVLAKEFSEILSIFQVR